MTVDLADAYAQTDPSLGPLARIESLNLTVDELNALGI